jgi:pimeloyl-ACP methyl ester carboxylesterase
MDVSHAAEPPVKELSTSTVLAGRAIGARMKVVVQERFAAPADLKSIRNEPLVVHQRSEPSTNRHLAVFVHGLGGARYGERSTWGSFPKYIFEDFPRLDIGLYSFRTAFRRLNWLRSIPVPREAEVFADVLGTLRKDRRYDWFILIGHSLGGLLCKGALSVLAERRRRQTIERVSDLILMATPQLGSLRVPALFQSLTHDARVLRAHSDFVQQVTEVFQKRFHCDIDPPTDDKLHLRAWAVLGAADRWVDPLSAGIGISDFQRLTSAGTHTEIVKPADKNAEAYRFVYGCLQEALRPKATPFRTDNSRAARFEELGDVRQLACQFFTEPISDIHVMEQWWRANRDVFQIVERVTKSKGIAVTATVGYFCVLPLTADGADRLRRGQMSGVEIMPSDMVTDDSPIPAVYIGAIAAMDGHRGPVLNFLQAHLRQLAGGRALRILARPVTEEGMTLVDGYAFQPVNGHTGERMGVIHETTITAWGSEERNRRRKRKPRNHAPTG